MGSSNSSKEDQHNPVSLQKPVIIWDVCYVNPKDTKIHCGMSIWQECLLDWIQVRITKDVLKNNITIPCPDNTCEKVISTTDIQHSFSRSKIELILDKFLNVYICNQNDIRKCPNTECQNAGIITPKPCSARLEWECCHYKWKDITQYTIRDKIERAIMGKHNFNSDFLSYFSEVIRGEPWPEWGIVIIKLGGCPHMVWQKWSYEFWWNCLGYFKGYTHLGDTFWPLRIFILHPFFVFFLISLNFKLCYSFSVIANLQKWVLEVSLLLLVSTLILLSTLLEAFFIDKLRRLKRFRPNYRGKEYKFIVIMLVLYPILWVFIISTCYYIPETQQIIEFLLYEVIIIACGALWALTWYLIYKASLELIRKATEQETTFFLLIPLLLVSWLMLLIWKRDKNKLKYN